MTDYIDPAEGTVWVVSSGSYSDYRVHCAAPSKKAAQGIVAALNGDETYNYFIEQVPVIDKAEKVTIYGMEAIVTDDGTVREESVRDRDEWNIDPLYPQRLRPVTVRWVRAPIYNGQAGRLEVYGLDEERVRKTYSDMRAELIADPGLRKRREFTR